MRKGEILDNKNNIHITNKQQYVLYIKSERHIRKT